MLDSDGQSIFSDASDSNDENFLSDGGSSCDDEIIVAIIDQDVANVPSPEMEHLALEDEEEETGEVIDTALVKPKASPLRRRLDDGATVKESLSDVTQRILSNRNKEETKRQVQTIIVKNDQVPRKKIKKASTPIRNRISNLKKSADRTYDIDLQRRREVLMQPTARVTSSVGDENDVNPFEMTLAEDDREDQKKRHRIFMEKFERINT